MFWLLTSAVCELPVEVQVLTLVGEGSKVVVPLLAEDNEAGESRIGCFRRITASTLVSCQCLRADSSDCCLVKTSDILSILFKSSR